MAGVMPPVGRPVGEYDGLGAPGREGGVCVDVTGGRGAAGRGGCCGTMARLGTSGGAWGGACPGSSTRSRMLGGTKRPAGRLWAVAGSAG